jgi:hypothetical protein
MSWNLEAEKYTITYNCEVVAEFEDEITSEDVKRVAIAQGIKQLGVEDMDGNELEASDFPLKEDITILQVNKAG